MARRFLFRALIPAATLALTGAIGLPPASASASWQINSIVGDPAGQTVLSNVAASGPDNAWVGGTGCIIASCVSQEAIVQHWNGQSWQPFTLPDSNVGANGNPVVIGTSSASNTWIFGADVTNIGYGVHVTNSGATETTLPATGGLSFTGAAVFSPSDAWAFGVTGDFFNAIFSAYAAHYDGQAWTQLPTPPVVPNSVSAPSSDDLWILGQEDFGAGSATFAAARWTGSGWQTVLIPDAADLRLPAGTPFNPVSILADSPTDVWVTADIDTTCPPCGVGNGVLLLHWNGNGWHSVDVPTSISQFDPDMASDGQSGFWVSGYSSSSGAFYLYHFLNDQWTSQLVPTQGGLSPNVYGLAWVPGTTSLWGASTLFNFLPNGTETSQGAIDQYGS